MASARSSYFWPVVSIVMALAIVVVALPSGWKSGAPALLRMPDFHFGLDLAGGTQLDFRISQEEMDQQLTALDQQIADLQQKGGSDEQVARLRNERQAIVDQTQNLVEAIR